MKFNDDREARVLISYATEPGDHNIQHSIEEHGLGETLDLMSRHAKYAPRLSARSGGTLLAMALDRGIRFIIPGDQEWPAALDDLGHGAPIGLWARGKSVSPHKTPIPIAFVGARANTTYGERITQELVEDAVRAGATIVSGMAYGIDAAAHRAALTVGGETVAFMAGGLERPYPQGHDLLFEQIIERGTAYSEVPIGSSPTRWRFLQRNRLIAAASYATVVVEAGVRSGSMNTVHHANDLGRPVGAVPGPLTSPASAGCHDAIRLGKARIVTSYDDIAALLSTPVREALNH